jgi:hypothetical protein
MSTTLTPFTFIILALAVWRVATLFANEHGPANVFGIIRDWAVRISPKNESGEPKAGTLGDGLLCEWCNSVWFGTIITVCFYFNSTITLWVCIPLCLSTITIMLKFFREMLEHMSTK